MNFEVIRKRSIFGRGNGKCKSLRISIFGKIEEYRENYVVVVEEEEESRKK